MPLKIAMLGAGSIGFTRRLMQDLLAVPEFADTTFAFMDIDPMNLDMVTQLCERDIQTNNLPARIISTLDRREALRDCDYVICMIRQGRLEAFQLDIDIHLKYGVDQCVGDTICAGGIMYAQRTIPELLGICKDIREVAKPDTLFINYSNPMAMNTWACNKYGGVPTIGLCHGVQGGHWQITSCVEMWAKRQGFIPPDYKMHRREVDVIAAGINHQTWFIKVTHKGIDLTDKVLEAFKRTPDLVASEPLRIDVLERFGYYSTETNGHLSEYLPWYRKGGKEQMARWMDPSCWSGGETGGYLRLCREGQDDYRKNYPKWMSGDLDQIPLGRRSSEHGSYIIEAMETGRRYWGTFNVENTGLITNLPDGCTVELPCIVDSNGIQPTFVGDLPPQCAATCRASVSVQEMAVEAAITGDRQLVKLAVLHDPLTSAVCTPDQVWAMCDEMFEKLAPWLPQFG